MKGSDSFTELNLLNKIEFKLYLTHPFPHYLHFSTAAGLKRSSSKSPGTGATGRLKLNQLIPPGQEREHQGPTGY